MADCCLIKKVATVEVYENKNEVKAYGFMAGDRNTPVMEVRFKHLWGESNLSTCKLRWIIVDDVGSLLVGEVPIQSDNTALINLPNELFTGDRRMKVQLTVASCDGERILNLQQFTDLKVINSLAPNEVVEPVYDILINKLYKGDLTFILDNLNKLENEFYKNNELLNTALVGLYDTNKISDNSLSAKKLKISSEEDKIKPEHLSEAVKSMMSGTTPVAPDIGDNTVTVEKIAPNAVDFSKLKNKPQQLISWKDIDITTNLDNSKTIVFKNDMVLQSQSTGRFVYFQGVGDATYTLTEGKKLVLSWDEKTDNITQDKSELRIVPVASDTYGTTLFTFASGQLFQNIISKKELKENIIFWGDLYTTNTTDGLNIKFITSGKKTFQNLNNGNFIYSDLNNMEFNLLDEQKLILKHDFSIINQQVENFDSKIIKKAVNSPLLSNETLICSYVGGNFYKHICFNDPPHLKTNGIFSWRALEINGEVVKFADIVIQSLENGSFFYYNGIPLEITLNEGEVLYLDWDYRNTLITQTSELLKKKQIASIGKISGIPLITRIGGKFYSEITSFNNYLIEYYKPVAQKDIPLKLRIEGKIKNIAPLFYKKLKTLKEDVNLVHIGDSISTNNYYTSQREDAMFRPPMMTEYCYPSFIEEVLRPDGQEYRRYDVPNLFTETGTGRNAEYDEFWDWVNTPSNNRPSWTRILEGTNCSVSYTIPLSACRCDYIYRTDCKNADNFTVTVSKGFGFVKIFDETTNNWVEANGYIISAKEDENWVGGQQVRKSINQKRLKMKVDRTINDGTIRITISNNGNGRLTYWGIQYSHREYMFNYLLQARGGHSISRIRTFEEWDVDYYKPNFILQQCCLLNENMDIATSDNTPKNMNNNTPEQVAERFKIYCNDLKNKSYSPEILTMSLWTATGNNPFNQNTDETNYGYSGERKISVSDYFNEVEFMYLENNTTHFNLFPILYALAKEEAKVKQTSIMKATTNASGVTGDTWTIDGGHLNDKGSRLIFDLIANVFVQ